MNVDRRSFIAAVGASVPIALAGCSAQAITSDGGPKRLSNNPPDYEQTLGGGEEKTLTFDLPEFGDDGVARVYATVQSTPSNSEGTVASGMLTIRNVDSGEVLYEDDEATVMSPGEVREYRAVDPGANGGETIEIEFEAVYSDTAEFRFSYGATAVPN